MGLNHCFAITVRQNTAPKRDLALSPHLLSLIPYCSLPSVILRIWNVMGNRIGVLIWVETKLSFLTGWLTWSGPQFNSIAFQTLLLMYKERIVKQWKGKAVSSTVFCQHKMILQLKHKCLISNLNLSCFWLIYRVLSVFRFFLLP